MTREQANEIRKIVAQTGYFNARSGELRFPVSEWMEGCTEPSDDAVDAMVSVLADHSMNPQYRVEVISDGSINCKYVVFM